MENKAKDFGVIRYLLRSLGQMVKATYFTLLATWLGLVAGFLVAPDHALQLIDFLKRIMGD